MKKHYNYIKLLPLFLCVLSALQVAAQTGASINGPTYNAGPVGWGVGASPNQLNVAGAYTTSATAIDNFFFAGPIEISGTVAPAFNDVLFSNGAAATSLISNTSGIDVAKTIQLLNGITTTSSSLPAMAIRLGTAATTTGSSAFSTTRYVDGYMSKAGATAFTFPLGDAAKYAPATFTNPAGSTINYIVGTPGSTTTFATQAGALQLLAVSGMEFFNTSNVNGSAPIGSSITIPYNNFGPSGYISDPTTVTIAGWNGTQWVNLSGVTSDQSGGSSGNVTVVLASALTGFSKFTVASTSAANALPVNFTSFTATNANCSALIKWSTGAEVNSSYFVIETSIDGNNFKQAMRVASKNAAVGSSYSVTLPLESASNFYRIKAVDVDGRSSYNTVIVTVKNTCTDNVKVSLYPNPTTNSITLYGLSGKNTLTIRNESGQTVASLNNTTFSQVVAVSKYPSGTYIISIVNQNGAVQNIKFVKN